MPKKGLVAVLGAGNMGTAIAQVVALNGYRVNLWNYGGDLEPLKQIKEKKIAILVIPPDLVFDSGLIKNLYQCLPTKVKFLDWMGKKRQKKSIQ